MPAWTCSFVSTNFIHHPSRNPKLLQAGLGNPTWVEGTLHPSKGKKYSSQKASPGRGSKTNLNPWLTTQKQETS